MPARQDPNGVAAVEEPAAAAPSRFPLFLASLALKLYCIKLSQVTCYTFQMATPQDL